VGLGLVWAGSLPECKDDHDFYAFLNGSLGKLEASELNPTVIQLPCDTMTVSAGSRLDVLPHTVLRWALPGSYNTLVIEGEISLAQNTTFLSTNDWQGIVVGKNGILKAKELKISGTLTPLKIKGLQPSIKIDVLRTDSSSVYLVEKSDSILTLSLEKRFIENFSWPPPQGTPEKRGLFSFFRKNTTQPLQGPKSTLELKEGTPNPYKSGTQASSPGQVTTQVERDRTNKNNSTQTQKSRKGWKKPLLITSGLAVLGASSWLGYMAFYPNTKQKIEKDPLEEGPIIPSLPEE